MQAEKLTIFLFRFSLFLAYASFLHPFPETSKTLERIHPDCLGSNRIHHPIQNTFSFSFLRCFLYRHYTMATLDVNNKIKNIFSMGGSRKPLDDSATIGMFVTVPFWPCGLMSLIFRIVRAKKINLTIPGVVNLNKKLDHFYTLVAFYTRILPDFFILSIPFIGWLVRFFQHIFCRSFFLDAFGFYILPCHCSAFRPRYLPD